MFTHVVTIVICPSVFICTLHCEQIFYAGISHHHLIILYLSTALHRQKLRSMEKNRHIMPTVWQSHGQTLQRGWTCGRGLSENSEKYSTWNVWQKSFLDELWDQVWEVWNLARFRFNQKGLHIVLNLYENTNVYRICSWIGLRWFLLSKHLKQIQVQGFRFHPHEPSLSTVFPWDKNAPNIFGLGGYMYPH